MKTSTFQKLLTEEIHQQGIDIIKYVDISHLNEKAKRSYPRAILIGIILSKEYLKNVSKNLNYVEALVKNKELDNDEFHLCEKKTDKVADLTAEFIKMKGFAALSQSEQSLFEAGEYDNNRQATPLPHKTIAGMAGIGWIGKHNLIISQEYGSAISMCSILTDAPLICNNQTIPPPQCGYCTICIDICEEHALLGKLWHQDIKREDIIDVNVCNTCFQCLVQCPWTVNYFNQ